MPHPPSQEAGRLENIIGWYHSHPGYGCWLSGIDVGTQMTNQKYQAGGRKGVGFEAGGDRNTRRGAACVFRRCSWCMVGREQSV